LLEEGVAYAYENADRIAGTALDLVGDLKDLVSDVVGCDECYLSGPDPLCEIGSKLCQGARLAASVALSAYDQTLKEATSVVNFAAKELAAAQELAGPELLAKKTAGSWLMVARASYITSRNRLGWCKKNTGVTEEGKG